MKLGLVDLTDLRLWELVAESCAFYAQRVPGRGANGPDELRTVRAMAAAPTPSDPPAAVEVLSTGGPSVPVRIRAPASGPATGVVLEIHGGGFYLGSAAGSDVRNRALSDALGLAVVSVDYRLAPEHLWPAVPDDYKVAALWLACRRIASKVHWPRCHRTLMSAVAPTAGVAKATGHGAQVVDPAVSSCVAARTCEQRCGGHRRGQAV